MGIYLFYRCGVRRHDNLWPNVVKHSMTRVQCVARTCRVRTQPATPLRLPLLPTLTVAPTLQAALAPVPAVRVLRDTGEAVITGSRSTN